MKPISLSQKLTYRLLKKCQVSIAHILLSTMVLFPLVRPGYILTLDMIFTPKLPAPSAISSSYLWQYSLHILNFILPGQIIEKLILVSIFILSGIGAHLLTQRVIPATQKSSHQLACYFAGIIYMINPFVYTRLMAGQYELLLGYSLIPFFIMTAWTFLNALTIKHALRTALLLTLISIVSIHIFGMAILVLLIAGVINAWKNRNNKTWLMNLAKYGLFMITLIAIASSYWLIPLLLGHGQTAQTIDSFTPADQQAFATVPGNLGLIGNVLALQGFWGDTKNLYLLPQDIFSWWLIPVCALWLLVGVGAIWAWKNQRRFAVFFSAAGILGLILAIGGAGTIFAPLNDWLYSNIPFFAGYRESQKFAVLIVLAYAYFGSAGIYWLSSTLRKRKATDFAMLGLLLPLLCTPLLLWGAAGQLKPVNYPADWYQVNKTLTKVDTDNAKILFLPWHLYMPFNFTNRVISNPAPQFFSVPIISSQDPEISGAHGYYDSTTQAINTLLAHRPAEDNQFARRLLALNIHYIVVSKSFDYKSYSYLNNEQGIKKYMDTRDLEVYRVMRGN